MTIDEAKRLLSIERECVNRNNQSFGMNCGRDCSKCDLLQNTDTLIEMYDEVVEWLDELNVLRLQNYLGRDEAFNAGKKIGYDEVIDDCKEALHFAGGSLVIDSNIRYDKS